MFYKIEITLNDNSYTGINTIVQNLHNFSRDFKFLINVKNENESNVLNIYLSEVFYEYLINQTPFKVLIEDYGEVDIYELPEDIVLPDTYFKYVNMGSYKKNSLRKYILKNKDNLEIANTFEDFVKLMKYDSPKPVHLSIFTNFKKEKNIDKLVELIQKDFFKQDKLSKNYFVFSSNSNKNKYQYFYEEIETEDILSKINETNSYGLVK